ncbi:MAG: hypothetical protein A3F85_02060 [Candidatus Ryanbacteria bacterium RIFCSPLOWO2_12_FULL_44_26]|nr:MAG: hypothetical protein A3F85_02060 [Candidatus Ryanbacteria bacterium RIFCSPLOWO2_12_FULL_44_26]
MSAAHDACRALGVAITSTPKFWRDESIPYEIARTYAELGKLDVVTEPGVVDGRPYLTHATGFPLTISLAGFFKLFGVGVVQSRIFMTFWIVAVLMVLYLVLRSFFGPFQAGFGTLLVSTFSSFYANGRTFTGEIPGFLFLLLALFFIYRKKQYILGGMLLAIAVVTKPSVYLLLLPAAAFEFFIWDFKKSLRFGARLAIGVLPVILLWIFIILPQPFSVESWAGMIDLYRHPFNEPSLFSRLPEAFFDLLTNSTIWYFGFLLGLILFSYSKGVFRDDQKRLLHFFLLFGVLSIIYFLRSPGWFRYLLVTELFILAFTFPAADSLVQKRRSAAVSFAGLLVVIQVLNFFFFSDIPSGRVSISTAEFINKQLLLGNDSTIGFIHMPTVAPLISSHRKYQIAQIGGKETYGKHPLMLPEEKLPDYIIGYQGEYNDIFERHYEFAFVTPEGFKIYRKK